MLYVILLDRLQTRQRHYAVTDFGDLAYCQSIRDHDGSYVLLAKAKYVAGTSEPTRLSSALGHEDPGVILQLTERT